MAATRIPAVSTALSKAPLLRLGISSYFIYDLGTSLVGIEKQKQAISAAVASGQMSEAEADLKELDLLRSTITTATFFTHTVIGLPAETKASYELMKKIIIPKVKAYIDALSSLKIQQELVLAQTLDGRVVPVGTKVKIVLDQYNDLFSKKADKNTKSDLNSGNIDDQNTVEFSRNKTASLSDNTTTYENTPKRTFDGTNNRGNIIVSTETGGTIEYPLNSRSFEEIESLYGKEYLYPNDPQHESKFLEFLKDKKVLDVSVAESTFVETLRQKNIEAEGIDIHLQPQFRGKDYYHECSANDTKLPSETYDVIFSTWSPLHYEILRTDMIRSTLSELIRLLKPNGSLFFTTPGPKANSFSPKVYINEINKMLLLHEYDNLHVTYKDISEELLVIEVKKLHPTATTANITNTSKIAGNLFMPIIVSKGGKGDEKLDDTTPNRFMTPEKKIEVIKAFLKYTEENEGQPRFPTQKETFKYEDKEYNVGIMCHKWRASKKGRSTNKISGYEINELNELGFDWGRDKVDIVTTPEEKIEIIKAFLEYTKKEEGEARFPTQKETFKYKDKEYKVGIMCNTWRSAKKETGHNKISDYEVVELDKLGFDWGRNEEEIVTPPEKKIEIIKAFLEYTKTEEGEARFPTQQETFKFGDKEYKVGIMCNAWRSAKKGISLNKISEYEINELNKLGFNWGRDKVDIVTTPEKKIEIIKAFLEYTKEQEGTARFPIQQETFKYEDKEYNIGKMCTTWRSAKKGMVLNKISDYEINELNKIGFDWGKSATSPEQKIEIIKAFLEYTKKEEGEARFPTQQETFKYDDKEYKVGIMCNTWRTLKREQVLIRSAIMKLLSWIN